MDVEQENASSPHPALGRLAGLCRRNSIDDYQKTLVNRIKRHFEKRRKQWEKDIQKQVNHFNAENTNRDNERKLSRNESTESTESNVALSDPITDSQIGINLIEIQSDRLSDGAERLCFKVDISSFLPDGAVKVQPGDHSLVLVGESSGGECASRQRMCSPQTVRKSLKFKGIMDPAKMRVHTTKEGYLQIEIETIPDDKTVKSDYT